MFFTERKSRRLFESLCADYYEKILRYLYAVLSDETAAKDVTQEVFLIACQKSEALTAHPNPGGFLFQTAKNLARKARSQSFKQMLFEIHTDSAMEALASGIADGGADIEKSLDGEIDENDYIEAVLSKLTEEKRKLYALYYLNGKTMAEVAAIIGAEEPAVRMRYVRLRREIKTIISEIAKENFEF